MSDFLSDRSRKSIEKVARGYATKRASSLLALGEDFESYRERMTELRKKSFFDFEVKLTRTVKQLEKNNFRVFQAGTVTQARSILSGLLDEARAVVKSKSNTAKEIGLEELIAGHPNNFGPHFETDLGDYIVGLMGTEDEHYVLPAISLSSAQIAARIEETFGDKVAADPEKLTHYLCGKIRKNILSADTAITGANFFTEDGKVVLLENEGNISLISRLAPRHIILCGIDKLVESVEDATRLAQTAAIFGTGQTAPQYISVIAGPSKTADIENQLVQGAQGAKEAIIVLIDNGRRQMLKEVFEGILRCLNCGACVNFCPVYRQKGKKFGGDYMGSKGIVTHAFQGDAEKKLEKSFQAGSFDCTQCENCSRNCPMKIELAEYVRLIRVRQKETGIETPANREMLEKIEKTGNPFGGERPQGPPDKLFCC